MPNKLIPRPFYYIRHGQTDWNNERRIQGFSDIPLNEAGRQQAGQAAEAIKGTEILTICTSPLGRALETAKILNRVLDCELIILDELKEACFGDHEGLVDDGWFSNWKKGRFTPTGGEARTLFVERATAAINKAIDRPGPVLIAAHGGLYGAIQHHLGVEDTQNLLPNCVLAHHTPPTEDNAIWQRWFVNKDAL